MIKDKKPRLAIVGPCFNEEEVLPFTEQKLRMTLGGMVQRERIDKTSFICFVDDGSRDKTWSIICELSRAYPIIGGVRLSRNEGHQNALIAGLFETDADLTISIDADLQDDVEAIPLMVDAALQGADIVYGVRRERASDDPFKRLSARGYYRALAALGVEIVYDHADFRLLSRRAVAALKLFGERNLFLRALVPKIGFETRVVEYERKRREAGVSKYPLRKMLSLAFDGVTSFSTKPLHIVTWLGFVLSVFSGTLAIYAIIGDLAGATVPGWASTVLPIYVISGVQLFSLGVIGEYVGKIYIETKARPRFVVAERVEARSLPGEQQAARFAPVVASLA